MRRFFKHALLALCLLIPATSAVVFTAATPSFADHDGDHSGYHCYEYDNHEYSEWQQYGSATYWTDYYGHYYECYDPASGMYSYYRMYGWSHSYWVYHD